MDGIVVINKPQGITSHDVVSEVRKKFHMKRVGHAGTLDPLATGVLIILLGKSTRLFDTFQAFDKAYRATFQLGTVTHTADIHGKVLCYKPFATVTQDEIVKVMERFVGNIEQTPPMVSAVKVGGKRLYQLARKGIEIKRQPRKIHINLLKLISFISPSVEFYVECSKGTYVRQLAHDIGESLGCGACITQIERTQVGPFQIKEAVPLENLSPSHIRTWPDKT